jgi:hypothetical protein
VQETVDPYSIEFLSHNRENRSCKLFSSKFLGNLSTRRDSCSVVLCLGPNTSCSLQRNPLPAYFYQDPCGYELVSLPTVCPADLWVDKRSNLDPSSVSGWLSRGRFHGGGKYCIRKIALTNLTRKDKALSGRCFRALFGITFGPDVP